MKAFSSAEDIFLITPSDTANIAPTIAILVAVAGNLRVTTAKGTDITIPIPAGYNPISVKRVWATGTTATGLYGLV